MYKDILQQLENPWVSHPNSTGIRYAVGQAALCLSAKTWVENTIVAVSTCCAADNSNL